MFEKEIRFYPAYDKRDPDPAKNCGIHGVAIYFYLKGEKGVIQFSVYTNWQLPHVQKEMDSKIPDSSYPYLLHKPSPADLGYHSHTPTYEGQEKFSDDCELLGGTCYYDGSSLAAKDMFNKLTEGGDEAVWQELEKYYYSLFKEED